MADLWQSKFFKPAPLDYLPLDHVVKKRKFVIEKLKLSELDDLFKIINEAVEHDDNIGVDEIDSVETLKEDLRFFHGFSIRENGSLVGAVFAGCCYLSRSSDSALAQIEVLLNHELFKGGYYVEFVLLAEKLLRDMKLGFVMACVYVFETCTDAILDLRREGYLQCLCLPFCGRQKTQGAQQVWMLAKKIDNFRKPRPQAEVHAWMEKNFKSDPNDATLTTDCLPQTYYFKSGTEVILRWVKPEEHRDIFNMFTQCMVGGTGYAVDEYHTFDKFVDFQINNKYVMVVEEVGTGRLLGYFSAGEPDKVKGAFKGVCSSSAVMNPAFRGIGIGSEMVKVFPAFLKHLGFDYKLDDTALVNRPMRAIENKSEYRTMGVVPFGVLMANVGWTDYIFSLKDIRSMPDFLQLCKESKKRAEAAKK